MCCCLIAIGKTSNVRNARQKKAVAKAISLFAMGTTSNASKKKVVAKASSTLREEAATPGIDKDLAFAILHELKKHINFKGSAQLFQQELEDMHLILTDQVVQGQLMKRAAGTPLPNETTDYLDKNVRSFADKEATRGSSNKHTKSSEESCDIDSGNPNKQDGDSVDSGEDENATDKGVNLS